MRARPPGTQRPWSGGSKFSPLPQVELEDTYALPGLKFLIGMLAFADGQELLVLDDGVFALVHAVEDHGAEKVVARDLRLQRPDVVESRERLRIGLQHDLDAGKVV